MKKERNLRKEVMIILTLSLIVMFICSVNASLNVKNYTIDRNYQGGDKITGRLNFSFSQLHSESQIITNFGHKISLKESLENQGQGINVGYSCSLEECKEGYSAEGEISQTSLDSGIPKIIGFKLSGDDVSVKSATISVTSDVPASCIQQLRMSIAGENKTSFQNNKYLLETCGSPLKGCFDNSLPSSEYQIAELSTNKYCQKIKVPSAPALKLAANIVNSTNGQADLRMGIYSLDGEHISSCNLPKHQTSGTQELSCIIEKSIIFYEDYYICLGIVPGTGTGNYKIKTETSGEKCGTDNLGSDLLNRDYDISIQPMKYDSVSMTLNQENYKNVSGEYLDIILDNYIAEKYGGNCTGPEGCFIPLKIYGSNQNLVFGQSSLVYTSGNTQLSTNTLFNGREINSTISSKKDIILDLAQLEFSLPLNKQTGLLSISLQEGINSGSTSSLASVQINISQGYSLSLNTLFAPIGLETYFKLSGLANVTKVEWDFGDGSAKKVSTNPNASIYHKFTTEGSYIVKVNVEAKSGIIKASKSFNVSVGDARVSSGIIIQRYQQYLTNYTTSFNSLPDSVKEKVGKDYSPVLILASLNAIKEIHNQSSTDEDYEEVIQRLMSLKMPMKVISNEKGKLPIIAKEGSDFSIIEALSAGKKITDEEIAASAINSWVGEKYSAEIEFTNYGVQLEGEIEDITTRIKVKIVDKNGADSSDKSAYLIIEYPLDAIKFEGAVNPKSQGSASYVSINGNSEILFLLPSEIDVQDLGIYLSPEISKLDLTDSNQPIDEFEPKFPWKFFLIWLIIIVFVFLAVYILLQEWYKRHYEKYLFPNRDDLYNLLLFIDNGRKAGKEDRELSRALNQSGWSGEQLSYAFKKIDGKRTGMWEIPIFNFIQKKEVAQEIARRREEIRNSHKVY